MILNEPDFYSDIPTPYKEDTDMDGAILGLNWCTPEWSHCRN